MKIKQSCCADARAHERKSSACMPDLSGHAEPAWNLSQAVIFAFLLLTLLPSSPAEAQPVYDIQYGNLDFPDARKIHKKGNLGQTAGSRTLYSNVVTVEGQQIDCILTTASITNGYFQYPTGFCPGTIPFDFREVQNCPNRDTSVVSLYSNEDRFFTPTFFFETGGGSCRFKFEFILGNSYDDATDKGQPVILKNVMVNSYDIDGNVDCLTPNPSLNQYNDFSGFNAAARATPGTSIIPQYNTTTGMTRFQSISNCNKRDIMDPATRIRVEYNFLQEFEVVVGMTGRGRAFFFLDFGQGPIWTPQYLGAPVLDLNTAAFGDGYNNITTMCSAPEKLSKGTSNILSVNNSISELIIAVSASDIKDGNAEIITPDINNSSAYVKLGSPFSGTVNFTLNSVGYKVDKTESGGIRKMVFTRSNGSTMTDLQAETLIDALLYYNSVNSIGQRRFTIWLREGQVTSTFAFFEIYGGCIVLGSGTSVFTARQENSSVLLRWETSIEQKTDQFSIERSTDGAGWETIHRIVVKPGGNATLFHVYHDRPSLGGVYYYRLIETDLNGIRRSSPQRVVRFERDRKGPLIFPNPTENGRFRLLLDEKGMVRIFDSRMVYIWGKELGAGIHMIDFSGFSKGIYHLQAAGVTQRFILR